MKKFVTILIAGTAVATFASPASAAMAGGRVEALVGWDHGSIDLADFGFDDSIDSDGVVFGIGAGYDFAVNATTSVGVDREATEATADLDVTGADGKVEKWSFETGGANALFRRGWRKDDLPAGTELKIDGWQARNGSKTVNARSITFKKDGRRLFAGTSNTNATEK